MTKVRKQHKKKVFNTSINRKRLRNRLSNLGPIECDPITQAWNRNRSVRTNLKEMGLTYDSNSTMKIQSYREGQKVKAISIMKGEFNVTQETNAKPSTVEKPEVVSELEAVAKAPKTSKLRLPKSHIEYITYFMDKYGNDYKAMAKDRRNYNQETWKQLRQKAKKFMKIPNQYAKFLDSKGLLGKNPDDDDLLKKDTLALEMDSD